MSIIKVIVFTIVATFVIFENIQSGSADKFTREQFLGVWYNLGTISPTYNFSNNITCYWIRVTKESRSSIDFKKDIRFVMNGVAKKFDGFGRIYNSKVFLLFPYFSNGASYSITSYNQNQELILEDSSSLTSVYALLSRRPSVSLETKAKFETLAQNCGSEAVFFQHNHCTYRTLSVPILP